MGSGGAWWPHKLANVCSESKRKVVILAQNLAEICETYYKICQSNVIAWQACLSVASAARK